MPTAAAPTLPPPTEPTARGLRLSRYHVASEVAGMDGQRVRVVMATRTGEVMTIAEPVWDKLVAGELEDLPAELLDELVDIELLVDDPDELAVVLGRSEDAIATSGVYKLVVQPSAACQLDCTYCGQVHSGDRLCADHQEAVLDRAETALSTGEYTLLSMGWFGSEPLLGLDVIEAMTPRLREIADTHGCAYDATIVSNGLRLTPELARRLDALGVSMVEITIDGPGRWHDQQRPYKSGRGSFAKIIRNVVAVARSDARLALSIRCNVTAASAEDVPAFIDLLAELGLQHGVARVYFAPIHDWGNDAHTLSLSKERFARLESGWRAHLLGHGFDPGVLPEPKPIVCMATARSSELVDAFGNIFNCTEVSYVPTYGEPNRYAIGHVDTGVDDSRRNLLGDFNDRIARQEVPCTSCHLLPICGGSCPKAWSEGEPACPPFKWNLGTRILLEAARHRDPAGSGPGAAPGSWPDAEAVLAAFERATAPVADLEAPRPDPPTPTPVRLGATRSQPAAV